MTVDNIAMWETRLSIADYLRRSLVYLWKQNICSSKLDVQKAKFSLAQFYRI